MDEAVDKGSSAGDPRVLGFIDPAYSDLDSDSRALKARRMKLLRKPKERLGLMRFARLNFNKKGKYKGGQIANPDSEYGSRAEEQLQLVVRASNVDALCSDPGQEELRRHRLGVLMLEVAMEVKDCHV